MARTITKCPNCKMLKADMFYIRETKTRICRCGLMIRGNMVIRESYAIRGCPEYWSDKVKEKFLNDMQKL